MTSDDVDVAAGVTAALVCAGVGFLAELVLAVWAYRKPGFKSLRVRVWEWKMEVGERLKERRRSRFFSTQGSPPLFLQAPSARASYHCFLIISRPAALDDLLTHNLNKPKPYPRRPSSARAAAPTSPASTPPPPALLPPALLPPPPLRLPLPLPLLQTSSSAQRSSRAP